MQIRTQIETQIQEKAMKDPDFRSELLKNPKQTIEKEYGVKLPGAFKVLVLEETAQTFYLVLPPAAAESRDGELTEMELSSVAAAGNEWVDQFSDAACLW